MSSPSHDAPRFLIYCVAYRAERYLCAIFDRIPHELFNRPDVQFLVNDDASGDCGPLQLKEWLIDRDVHNVIVLQNRVNQGHGGNQKVGYRFAIDCGFDCVILLPGDGQYAPELLPRFIQTWSQSQPDVLLGSRTNSLQSAGRGGMPLYKLFGNRILTTFQNRLTGWTLTEYQTGYRVYATAFLQQVPFEVNSNDSHFDTEILLQAAHIGASVVEIPIPPHHGDGVCHVPGLKYALNAVAATTQYKLHQLGMLCSLKLRRLSTERYRDKSGTLYSTHSLALSILKRVGARRVLDIGCGPGHVAARCETLGMTVTGLDAHAPPPGRMTQFHRVNLESDSMPVHLSDYDAVLSLDVVEHLAIPEDHLLALRNQDRPRRPGEQRPLLVLSTPNVAFISIRLNLLLGRFPYAERGILDITHKRLFTRRSLLQTLNDCGYDIEKCHPVGAPFEAAMGGSIGRFLGFVSDILARIWPTLFAFQFLVECRPRSGVRQVLADAFRVYDSLEVTE